MYVHNIIIIPIYEYFYRCEYIRIHVYIKIRSNLFRTPQSSFIPALHGISSIKDKFLYNVPPLRRISSIKDKFLCTLLKINVTYDCNRDAFIKQEDHARELMPIVTSFTQKSIFHASFISPRRFSLHEITPVHSLYRTFRDVTRPPRAR